MAKYSEQAKGTKTGMKMGPAKACKPHGGANGGPKEYSSTSSAKAVSWVSVGPSGGTDPRGKDYSIKS